MQNSNICILSNTVSGINAFRKNLCKHIINRDANLTIIAYGDEKLDNSIIESASFKPVDVRATNQIAQIFRTIFKIILLKDKKYDKLIAYGIFSVIYAFFIPAHKKTLFLAGLGSGYLGSRSSRIKFQFLLLLANLVFDQVVVLNEADRDVVSKFYNKSISRHFSEGQDFLTVSKNLETKHPKSFKVSFVGRLIRDKGILDYIELAKRLPEHHFNIFGEIDQNNPTSLTRNQCEQLFNKIPNLTWYGHTSNEAIWRRTDCLLMLSKREGTSTVVLEAIANRVCVLGYAAPGVIDIFNTLNLTNNGLIEKPNVVKLAENIADFKKDLYYNVDEAQIRLGKISKKVFNSQFDELMGIKHAK
jgi:glycosyltransferase involved in cell wall biosynthesis